MSDKFLQLDGGRIIDFSSILHGYLTDVLSDKLKLEEVLIALFLTTKNIQEDYNLSSEFMDTINQLAAMLHLEIQTASSNIPQNKSIH